MNITVYSTTTCPYCVMLKRWLDDKKVQYTEYMVDKNPYAAEMMIQQSGQRGVPFSTIEHEDGSIDKIIGFDRASFEKALTK
ncbi:MAG: glutaredoxin family protein [Candidatus Saccharimonadales bacterium]